MDFLLSKHLWEFSMINSQLFHLNSFSCMVYKLPVELFVVFVVVSTYDIQWKFKQLKSHQNLCIWHVSGFVEFDVKLD